MHKLFAALLVLAVATGCLRAGEPAASTTTTATEPASAPIGRPGQAPVDLGELAKKLTNGIDVSWHSGSVDWSQVSAEGHRFAFIKATEGMDYTDRDFALRWGAIKSSGLIRGAYHFYVSEDDPVEQAQHFISQVALEPGDLAPVVDIELLGKGTKSGLPDRFRRFLVEIEKHYGVKPIIYTSSRFWDTNMNDEFGEYPLWIAEYDVSEPRLPSGWKRWHIWQWSGDAAVKGVEKGADLSRVNDSIDPLTLLVR